MAFALVRSALGAIKEKGLKGAFRAAKEEGYFAALLDGNLANSKFRIDGVKLVGVDKAGNRYYEKMSHVQHGRHRWVVYADKVYNASAIPPEWHGWLHHITDHTPEQLEGLRPSRYGVEHMKNRTGEGEQYIYHAKGHALNPNKRDWKRYEEWRPVE
ncbi:NADH dehydrogenase (ubiquinone) 1 alpha subcomplex subunit 12 [Marchantia polymorpha subsp. ruderalis]|uniref:NADH dehydrogenase [ubiquinone] 1 alpha subcomplex subunit 12 n=2 Tax=Marchantia polymorpha TaxID=3197 RepID=A0A176VW72_MARPO|nr:hypothetical protein AXG93_4094s1000 [Marchantia polymorpha subsp. ruderalis]PTQ49978.1 hypothetical protein MARPO_0001s0046 [Marchantia polymorpha]BBM98902.1 hypothetical protein Mp_1g17060 [Marchantia polymorpha subsp. ruderalis]|eukprot:PTQ49978.1 hypothetical protein MARPO_0001s0046 [Marchantia polymorpha]